MTTYRVKGESFRVRDGAYAGREYVRGRTYTDIPPEEKRRFVEVRPPAKKTDPKPAAPAKFETGGKNS